MKSIKQKYTGMKHSDLTKALTAVNASLLKSRMSLREDPKAYAEIFKHRYERALIKTLLTLSESQ